MKQLMASTVISAFALLSAQSLIAAEIEPINIPALQQEAKGVIKTLAGNLGSELKHAAKAGGLPAAIQVCNTKASPITQAVAEDKGWTVGRTSLKLRNEHNAPDDWEKTVLKKFEKQAAAGANLQKMLFGQVLVDDDGNKVFRLMKAIPVGDKCLACHGSKIEPEVAEKLNALYPADNARGFNAGDLRGAFSLQKSL